MNRVTSIYLDGIRFSAAVVVFLDHYSMMGNTWLWWAFPYGSEAVLAFFVLSGFVIGYVTERRETTATAYAVNRMARIFSVALPALAATALIQGAHAAYYSFAALRWRGAGIPDAVVGLLIAEGIVAEVALFVWGRRLVERIGPGRLTMLAAGASVVRWAALAFVVDPLALAAMQALHAGTFAFQHLSAMQVLGRVGPARAATAQAWLSALGYSMPGAALVWLAGRLYARQPAYAFLAMAAVAALAVPVGARLRDEAG